MCNMSVKHILLAAAGFVCLGTTTAHADSNKEILTSPVIETGATTTNLDLPTLTHVKATFETNAVVVPVATIDTQIAKEQKVLKVKQDKVKVAKKKAAEKAQAAAKAAADKAAAEAKAAAEKAAAEAKAAADAQAAAEKAAAEKAQASTSVLGYAQQFIGVPYVYGGTTPSGFDCSGFTSWVFRNTRGIEIGRTTYDQIARGTHVSASAIQPGDIVVQYGGGHVGIYMGNGMMIHAPKPGRSVVIESVGYGGIDYGLRF
jgi:cell wall-associated NlpC family hydrolase